MRARALHTSGLLLLLLALDGCAGFRAVERGQWRLVWVDPSEHEPDDARAVITRDAYEAEVTAGTRRGVEVPAGFTYPTLQEVEAIGLAVGEIAGFRVDEAPEADLQLDGAAVQAWWGPVERRETWKVDTDVTVRESSLYLKGLKRGSATLRLSYGTTTKDVRVTVK